MWKRHKVAPDHPWRSFSPAHTLDKGTRDFNAIVKLHDSEGLNAERAPTKKRGRRIIKMWSGSGGFNDK